MAWLAQSLEAPHRSVPQVLLVLFPNQSSKNLTTSASLGTPQDGTRRLDDEDWVPSGRRVSDKGYTHDGAPGATQSTLAHWAQFYARFFPIHLLLDGRGHVVQVQSIHHRRAACVCVCVG